MSKIDKDKTKTKKEEGQALLEFSLVFVFLVLVLFGIIDFARIFFGYATMSNAAREGARYGIVHPGEDLQIESAARQRMVVIGGSEPDVQITYPDGCTDPMCPIRVRVSSDMDVWTPIIPGVTLVATSTMHIE